MATVRSVDFLPEIFQTDANKQFLAATLDQLIQEPKFKKTQGLIGRSVGPGVNPNDRYVIESDKTRTDYQLEPGVVSLEPDTDRVRDVITYPGMNDAIGLQGGIASRPDRLYNSEYYSWDPFVDFDTFVNFSQYFWIPDGPAAVDVASVGIPTQANFPVTRQNGVYTFGGVSGENPTIELVRGGSYTFQTSQNAKETVNYRVRNAGTSAYTIDAQSNPTLTLARGNTYVFNLNLTGAFPFWIKTAPTLGKGETYNSGVTRNGSNSGLVTFVVPEDAPDLLYYAAENQANMQGQLRIVNGVPGTGPGFWIQSAPGVAGVLPATPNISSRDVFGVSNNGQDLGTVVFNVPYKTSQSFYYNLNSINNVDLITELKFDQINNRSVNAFVAEYGGIDGITNLNGRTLIFTNPNVINPAISAVDGGWVRTTLFDPLPAGAANNGLPGSYDSLPYDQTTEIPVNQRTQLWQISYVNNAGTNYIQLSKIQDIADLTKFTIRYGTEYSSTQWYKDDTGTFVRVPLLTAAQDILYYQDGTDPEIFGQIKLIDQSAAQTLFVDEIIGKTSYTAPNGVTLSNGLKVKFTGAVSPEIYRSGPSLLSYSATESGTNYITAVTDTADLYVNQQIVFSAPTLGGLVPGTVYYVRSFAANGLKFTVSLSPGGPAVALETGRDAFPNVATTISNREYYVSGVGTAIELLPVDNFIVPETYAQDADADTLVVEPDQTDYITISRASQDLNAWSRSNRWFHIDVINATAEYNNTPVVLDNNYRAKRPIIQFRPGIRLWNMGTQGKQPVDVIDFEETDAFSNIDGSTAYTVNGYALVEGSRVIFAADTDADVRNKIYQVSFIIPDSVTPLIPQPIINLTLAPDGEVLTDQSTVVLSGNNTAGKTYWFDGVAWAQAQQKTGIQQAPLYNVYDSVGISFGDNVKYPSTTFAGSKLFSYAVGNTNILDPVLQFPLQYLNINNVGDIVFENNLYKDTFLYVEDNASVTLGLDTGSVREYETRTEFDKLIGWQTAAVTSQIYQQFKFNYSGTTLKLDVAAQSQTSIAVPVIKIYVGSVFQDNSTYTYTTTADSTTITLQKTYAIDDVIEVLVLSNQTSQVAFYQVPINLESNPLNENSELFTLGTVRSHYQSICENLPGLTGAINGANNLRDLGNVVPFGLVILQQSAPLTLAGYFLRSEEYNIFNALQYNSREYIKFKAQMLDAVLNQNIGFRNTAEILDTAIQDVTLGKIDSQPFYWSDMIPSGVTVASNTYTVSFITGNTFDTVQVYNYTSANYLGLLVYKNSQLLTRGVDYVVATDGPRITLTTPLIIGDSLTINEYAATYGSFIPNTPTKMGLYPAYEPGRVLQKSSTGTVEAIRGHDGSTTPLFGDIRDDVLLEFETRIYNNLKLDGNPVPLNMNDVMPGQFRSTGYSFQEINNILSQDFLSYCGWNKLDYKVQQYSADNSFTWNYSSAQNKLNNENMLGAWRGIYRYTYDTQQPEYTPWEMLGLSIRPTWWNDRYGPAPYTRDNLVLWDDIAAGRVADPVAPYTAVSYVRPGLLNVLPTGTEGELLSPAQSIMGTFNETQFQKSWVVGDGGPVEASWWNSSSYPFAVMRVLALTRPAKFFALFADRDLYKYNEDYQQYLYNNRFRLDANGIEVYGNGRSKASFVNWIVDYNRLTGLNSTADLTADLKSLDVRLCYRMASFSDKQYIKLYTEKSSPNSQNTALLIPDESYDILLYKNQPFDRVTYSSVTIQRTAAGGFAVNGYSVIQPYFNILESRATGRLQTYSSGGITVQVPTFYTDSVVQVPYGFEFTSATSVADFLLSYGKFLERQGLQFTDIANGYVLDWPRMVNEFLYWSQQGWATDAIINLNPLASGLTVTKPQAIVNSIKTQTIENSVLTQNSQEFPARNLNIVRLGNTFSMQALNSDAISFVELNYTTYEHMIVLSNQSVFGDLIYDPTTGARQSRLNLIAMTSTDWNGSVDAPGFILNQDNVEEWTGTRTYSKGEIVKYKNVYWSALTIVQPSMSFNFNDWTQSDYVQTEFGLLPNLSNKANQLVNSYNINVANIETDNDLLSYGLIGFRPRQYMAALNLDDVSQVNVYRQFLGSKGTALSTELFRGANFGKEAADYDVYENWAVQRAVYGANANRSFFELRLNRALLNANPSLVQVTLPQQTSDADQTILLSDVWRQSYRLTSPDILPTTTSLPTDIALPTAGYVNLDDVDITVFDINEADSLDENLDIIQVDSRIWVAKVNEYDWNIYRAQAVPGTLNHVCDNLNGTSRAIFGKQHDLVIGDKLIIKFFDQEVDGVYQVIGTPDLNTVNIVFQFEGDRTVVNGEGLGFTLKTMRVAQASDIADLPYANQIRSDAKVWVDNNGAGAWSVLEKQQVFGDPIALTPDPDAAQQNEQFGASVTQASNKLAILVGSPGYSAPGDSSLNQRGGVYVYVNSFSGTYSPVSPLGNDPAVLTLDVTGVRGYGNAVDFGDQAWAVAGASASLGPNGEFNNGYAAVIYQDPTLSVLGTIPFAQWQLLTQPGTTTTTTPGAGEFGHSVVMSQDERWMYIGAPGLNQVHAYGRVDWQNQFVRARGDAVTRVYDISNAIQIDQATQLKVSVDGLVLTLNTDYTVNGLLTEVTLVTAPALDTLVDIQRIFVQQLDSQVYYDVPQTSSSGGGSGAEFTIVRLRGEVGQPGGELGSIGATSFGAGYTVSDTITIAASSFGGGADGVNDAVLTVTAIGTGGSLAGFNIAYTPPALETVFDLGVNFFTAASIDSFSVTVNNDLYRPNIDYTFNNSTQELTFVTVPSSGAVIVINAQSYFEYVDTITASGLTAGARFGESVSCTTDGRQVLIGAPNQTVDSAVQAGAVYVFDRNVQKFIRNNDSSNSYVVLGTPVAPVTVYVNNTRLINQTNSVVGAEGTFSVSGSTVTIAQDLEIGDVIEIETNQFELVQVIEQNTVAEFSNFGAAVDLCAYNCSLYVGEPQSSVQIYKGGMVERNVNQSRTYGTITATVANPALTAGHTLRVNNIDVAVPASNPTIQGLADAINGIPAGIQSGVPNVVAAVNSGGFLSISVKNSAAAAEGNKLQVAPGSVNSVFSTLGFDTFVWTQNIVSPNPIAYAGFGSSVNIDTSAINLVVGAPQGSLYFEIEFDQDSTIFDIGSTVFFSTIFQSGAVYTFDFLPSSTPTVSNPGKFVFGTQMYTNNVSTYANFGAAVNYTSGVLTVGSPTADIGDSSGADYGSVFVYENATRALAWQATTVQQPVVDIRLLNSVFLYDQITSATTEFLDFMDPLQGKILGAARQNIDYIGAIDPASYNAGPANIRGTTWAAGRIGEVWWNTSTVRFIDPNQDNIVYASRRWAQLFPGSSVDVYQWIESDVPPANYAGEGTVFNTLRYTVNSSLSFDGTIVTRYYFWVRGITSTSSKLNKTLPVSTVASYIESPRASGIPYLAPINASTVALYNSGDFIVASDTVLHIEFDRELTTDNVHVEYELIAQDRADGFLSNNLYRKLQDSFCGVDTFGNQVPDLGLSPAERYGVQFRPRQSMFVDRFEALRNYLTRANAVLRQYTITESRIFNLLNSSEPEPSAGSGLWNLRVANLEILGFQNIYAVPLGYKYLVETDSRNRGLWTIYTVQLSETQAGIRETVLTRVQNFNTPDYWSYIDWYRPGYNTSSKITTEVSSFSQLDTLSVPVGSSVKVTANAQGKFEIYLRTELSWDRVGLQDGTIEFSAELWDYALGRFGFDLEVFDAQYYDQEPVIETRKIIQAINQELFIDDLAIERNRALVLMFNYVLSEFSAPEWLVKTSLIDVDHRIRDLVPYQNYIRDNQEFVEDYIQEVKPYHVQIREFNLKYAGFDDFRGDVVDFDVPAYFNTTLEIPEYTSPVLLPYTLGTAFNAQLTTQSDLPASSTVWTSWPYSAWFQNYLLNIIDIQIINGGSGYNEPPLVTFVGSAAQPAQGRATINSVGQVSGVVITTPGVGYRATPQIVFSGGNGINARAYAVMGSAVSQNYSQSVVPAGSVAYSPVRTFRTTMKFDRCQYVPSLSEWNANAIYQNGDLVRYDDRVWQAASTDSTAVVGPTFDLENWQLVNAGTYNNGVGLSGVDRTMGLYVPGVNSPGLELPLLIDGVDYPGVQVYGEYFLGNTNAIDAEYRSEFTDTALGNRFSDINVNGGEFIGPYEGHAPEELINGSEFDTLDFRVFTRPGSDWSVDGHGFEIGTVRFTYEPAIATTYSWADVVENPVQILASNLTTGVDLSRDIDYTLNWSNQTITLLANAVAGDIINISVYEAGGGSQLYRANYIGVDVGPTVVIPVNNAEIYDVAVFVNGQLIDTVSWVPYAEAAAWNVLNSYQKLTVVVNTGNYYRALQTVPVGTSLTDAAYWLAFVPTLETQVTFGQTFDFNDGVALLALGITTPEQYSWSTPQVQTVVANAATVLTKTITLINSLEGTNPANMIVTRNGLRLQPAEGIEWIGDDSSVSFGLPQRGGYQQSIIDPATDVLVWVDNVLQTQSLGAFVGDFSVTNWPGSNVPGRQVVFATPPAAGARILISVNTIADYVIAGNQIQIASTVNLGDVFAITTWNDTAQQNILTQVFVGPVESGVVINEPYDSTDYDPAVINDTPGSYDFTTGTSVANNQFDLQRTDIVASRLWVSLDGYRLFEGADYTVENGFLILALGAIGPAQVLAVTQFTNSITPEEMGFRIFQDMRGVQATYRITRSTTTQVAIAVTADADEIFVADATALSEPNLDLGIFGAVIIDGERIMYRVRDLSLNKISSLLRGTAGTGAAPHAAGTDVTDLGRGNLLDQRYQNYVVSDTTLSDGSSAVYYAPSIDIDSAYQDSSSDILALEVYVGGVRQYAYSDTVATSQYRWIVTDFDPVAVEFLTDSDPVDPLLLPPAGVEVTILVRRGVTWYAPGVDSASNGVALQDTNTEAARFLRGL